MADGPATSSPKSPTPVSVRPGQVVALVLAVVAVVFIAQNRERVTINLFTVDVSAPVWLILTIMVLLGMAVGALLRWRR
ncbi:LapA family protein [Geodermatophilus sp. SYSU D00814]